MKALILVDLQNDFFETGNLPVPNASDIIPIINNLTNTYNFDKIIFTKDSHTENHSSFTENGGLWPKHCVKNTNGWEIHKDIVYPKDIIIEKGSNPDKDSFSGFYIGKSNNGNNDNNNDNNNNDMLTPLHEMLQNWNITELYICGLAYEYCVYETVMDAIEFGYKCYLIENAVKGIDSDNIDKCRNSMIEKGVILI